MRPCLTKNRAFMKLNSLAIRAAKLAAILMAVGHSAGPLAAQEAVQQLEEVQVRADYDRAVDGVFLPDVQGTKIHAGKKTSNIDLEQIPDISMDNYRQVIAKTPGLILAEENTPLLELEQSTARWLQAEGDEPSRRFFMWIAPGTHPKIPDGRKDDTHFVAAGADAVAVLAAAEIRSHAPALARWLRK